MTSRDGSEERIPACIALASSTLTINKHLIAEYATKNRIPTVFAAGEFPEAGGLASYGSSYSDQAKASAIYVDKILKGAKPADLPIQQPTKLDLVINLKTAKAIGIRIPQDLLLRADRVIE